MRTIVIGGGASGVVAAIAAAERGDNVLVLERNAKPLKKLGVTGNGRCNLMNLGAPVYYGDAPFAARVLAGFPATAQAAFWRRLGVPLREESEGRVYPAALQASAVTDALLLALRRLNVRLVTGARVVALSPSPDGFALRTLETTYQTDAKGRRKPVAETERRDTADRVIVACGGAAAPAHGTDGSAYGLLTQLGHTLVAPRPALCALLTDKRLVRDLSGQRVRASLRLCGANDEPLHASDGELLFGDDALSGIAAMQLARFVAPQSTLHVDLLPALCLPDKAALLALLARLSGERAGLPVRDWLTGMFAAPMARALTTFAGFRADEPVPDDPARVRRLADTIGELRFPVLGVRGFEQAQVTAGGLSTAEFDPATLESRLCPRLYAVGEALNVDGDCGGFNLMFAFASGFAAGSAR